MRDERRGRNPGTLSCSVSIGGPRIGESVTPLVRCAYAGPQPPTIRMRHRRAPTRRGASQPESARFSEIATRRRLRPLLVLDNGVGEFRIFD